VGAACRGVAGFLSWDGTAGTAADILAGRIDAPASGRLIAIRLLDVCDPGPFATVDDELHGAVSRTTAATTASEAINPDQADVRTVIYACPL
jgi:hypothetical protein